MYTLFYKDNQVKIEQFDDGTENVIIRKLIINFSKRKLDDNIQKTGKCKHTRTVSLIR